VKQLAEIKAEVERLASLIEVDATYLPTYGLSEQTGRPHIEVNGNTYHLIQAERGSEFARMTTQDLDELLYVALSDATFLTAVQYELRHRVVGQDSRRVIFQRQIELLTEVSPIWAQRRSAEIAGILGEYPLDDRASVRATLTGELRQQGYAPEDAWQMALERYPRPTESGKPEVGRP
jgi:hypothetical protein